MNRYFNGPELYLLLILLSSSVSYSQTKIISPIPENSRQMILVLTDSIESTAGMLLYYQRESENSSWYMEGDTIPVVIGRNGLGWGRGLHLIDSTMLPIKTEGDGRSPAGVFKLSSAFGYADAESMKGLKIPYIHITELLECIDDTMSGFYNQLILRTEVENIDWQSSEKMYFSGIWYQQGVIVEHNTNRVVTGAGSCIFLHNWSTPDETTAGCTEMDPVNMKNIIYWLKSSAKPVLVQLTKKLCNAYKQIWKLPETTSNN